MNRLIVDKFLTVPRSMQQLRHRHPTCLGAIVIAMLLTATASIAQTRTGLPFDLQFGMARTEAENQLKALAMYKLARPPSEELTYSVPDQSTKTTNSLFLKFDKGRLVEISSMKSRMDAALYRSYLDGLLRQSIDWKKVGVETIVNDSRNAFFLFRDARSYITIDGAQPTESAAGFAVSLIFTDRLHYEKSHPSLR